ncbi:MAG: thermonuclease family protein [Oceanococcus sp.]|nr:MAG: thermonuclease family protein [Oceanococcus sp.]
MPKINAAKKPAPYRSPFQSRKLVRPLSPHGIGMLVAASVAIVAAIAIVLARSVDIQRPEPDLSPKQEVAVIDGDTLNVNGRRIRIFGIDAPEKGQPCTRNGAAYDCGAAASDQLRFIVAGERLQCERKSNDRWGREVAICTAGDRDIGRQMIRQGWAIAYREYSTAYVPDEEFARENSLGMWAKEFDLPKDWRQRRGK